MKRGTLILHLLFVFMFTDFGFADSDDDREDARKKMRGYFSRVFSSAPVEILGNQL